MKKLFLLATFVVTSVGLSAAAPEGSVASAPVVPATTTVTAPATTTVTAPATTTVTAPVVVPGPKTPAVATDPFYIRAYNTVAAYVPQCVIDARDGVDRTIVGHPYYAIAATAVVAVVATKIYDHYMTKRSENDDEDLEDFDTAA